MYKLKNTPISTNCITEICDNLLTYENDEVMSNLFFFLYQISISMYVVV